MASLQGLGGHGVPQFCLSVVLVHEHQLRLVCGDLVLVHLGEGRDEGRIDGIRAAGRKGPPDAVRISLRTSLRSPARRH